MDIPGVCQDWILVIGLEGKRDGGGSFCRGPAMPQQATSTGESNTGFLGRGGQRISLENFQCSYPLKKLVPFATNHTWHLVQNLKNSRKSLGKSRKNTVGTCVICWGPWDSYKHLEHIGCFSFPNLKQIFLVANPKLNPHKEESSGKHSSSLTKLIQ